MYVYFIQSGKKGPIKIGKAKNIEKRMASLQTANAYKLHLVALIRCETCRHALALESKLHGLFKDQRLHGEWFRPNINFKRAMGLKATPNFTTVPRYQKILNEIPEDCRQHMDSIMCE